MAKTFQFRRGDKKDLPLLKEGEPGFVLDEKRLYVGDGTGNVALPNREDLSSIKSRTEIADETATALGLNPVDDPTPNDAIMALSVSKADNPDDRYASPVVAVPESSFLRGYIKMGRVVIVNCTVRNAGIISGNLSSVNSRSLLLTGFPEPYAASALNVSRAVSGTKWAGGVASIELDGSVRVSIPGGETGYDIEINGMYLAKS